jgi:hypothetical protein
MRKRKGDIKPGEIVKGWGIIVKTDPEGESNEFFDGHPNWDYLDSNDYYYGAVCTKIDPNKECTVITDQKKIKQMKNEAIKNLQEYIKDRAEEIRLIKRLLPE